MKMGGWHWERVKRERFGRIILRIFIIGRPTNGLQSTFKVLMELREVTT